MTNPSAWTLIDFTALCLLAILALGILGGAYLKILNPLWLLPLIVMGPVVVSMIQAFLNLSLAGAVITFCIIAGTAFAIMLWNEDAP